MTIEEINKLDDWRIMGQTGYLYAVDLKKARWQIPIQHKHCEFCFDKFSLVPEDLKNGYCTLDEHWWICEDCFQDFKDIFQWRVVE